jgi:inosine/xanthosine triphosphate pyrophosphatase family protein
MLYFITGNAGKFTEIAAIVPGMRSKASTPKL